MPSHETLVERISKMTPEEQLQKIKEIRQGRILPAKVKAPSKRVSKQRMKNLKNLTDGMTPEQRIDLLKSLKEVKDENKIPKDGGDT